MSPWCRRECSYRFATVVRRAAEQVAAVSLLVVEASAALPPPRAGRLSNARLRATVGEVDRPVADLHLIELITNAAELAEQEARRGDDALRLAAARFVEATVLASADNDLCDAAARRGLHIANPVDA